MKLEDIKLEMRKQGPAIIAGFLFIASQEMIRSIFKKLSDRRQGKKEKLPEAAE